MTASVARLLHARRSLSRSPRAVRWLLVGVFLVAFEVLARTGQIHPLTAPAPSDAFVALFDTLRTAAFLEDLGRTFYVVGMSFALGMLIGIPLGVVSWRIPVVGGILEPYLITLYAMPTLVFYPIMIAILGLGPAPVIVISTTMAMIPIALNTMVALKSVKQVLLKLGASFSCSRGQVYRRILLPAAVPLAVVGLRLGLIYAIIGTIALEFILADRGLGFAIAMAYRDFEVPTMYGLIVFVTVMSFAVSALLHKAEQHVRKDMV